MQIEMNWLISGLHSYFEVKFFSLFITIQLISNFHKILSDEKSSPASSHQCNSGVQIDNRYLLVDGLELKPQIAGFFLVNLMIFSVFCCLKVSFG